MSVIASGGKGVGAMTISVERYGHTRYWAVYIADELLCVTVYKKGANAVKKRLEPAGVEAGVTHAAECEEWILGTPRENWPATLAFVPWVSRSHGEIFVERLLRSEVRGLDVWAAIDATRIIEWPAEGEAAQLRYNELVDEILNRTLVLAQTRLASSFVAAAREILAREQATNSVRRI